MSALRPMVVVVVLAVLASACSGNSISADTCDEVTDVTIEMLQRLIDDVDAQAGELTVQDFIDADGDLPSIDAYEADAARIDEIAEELGCSQAEISAAVEARAGELTANSDLGRFLVNAIRSGGL
jgi:hypothetical protein